MLSLPIKELLCLPLLVVVEFSLDVEVMTDNDLAMGLC